ncbi:MAG: Peptidoglycan-binding domain 1 protein, partial [Myxococcales bacterium]|nr:Peptidoglycan-binding domain 1 protein [Myxococcales bacterium]
MLTSSHKDHPRRFARVLVVSLALGACRSSTVTGPASSGHPGDSEGRGTSPGAGPVTAEVAPSGADGGSVEGVPVAPLPESATEGRALVVAGGRDQWMDAAAATAAGYTLVDLSDDWTPYIFAPQAGPDGQPMFNRYRRIFVGLANDQLDEDGEPLPPGEKNYLELYGIFPSLSVLRARFVADEAHACHDQESADAIAAVETVTYVAPADVPKEKRRIAKIAEELDKARVAAKVETLDELAARQPALAPKVKLIAKRAAEKPAMAAVERRLTCEGLLGGKGPAAGHHTAGVYDDAMRVAVRRFQQKHMIYESNYLREKTVTALARPLLDNDYDGFRRALRERVVAAATLLEDGSTKAGDLVESFTAAAIEQTGLTDAAAVLAFFKRHPATEFKRLRLAVKLPPRPAYYADHMDLQIVVDRGDIWYDLPFDDKGNFHYPPRKKYPTLTVYTKVGGKLTALARWRTTIGGWRAEQASDGYEYYRYKQSDVGPRVIRQVVSGPV